MRGTGSRGVDYGRSRVSGIVAAAGAAVKIGSMGIIVASGASVVSLIVEGLSLLIVIHVGMVRHRSKEGRGEGGPEVRRVDEVAAASVGQRGGSATVGRVRSVFLTDAELIFEFDDVLQRGVRLQHELVSAFSVQDVHLLLVQVRLELRLRQVVVQTLVVLQQLVVRVSVLQVYQRHELVVRRLRRRRGAVLVLVRRRLLVHVHVDLQLEARKVLAEDLVD